MDAADGPVLITGCSTGIGHTTALTLLSHGHQVYATARCMDTLRDLADAGATVLPLDVTNEDSMVTAVAHVEDEHGSVAALVNNAGYGEYGPVETVSLALARKQFETNFFGLARMCQLVLPGMRRAGRGRIVNMSTVGGKLTFPGGGFYNSSKFAVEALSDALRFETKPFGISVSVVEPNLIRHTRFEEHVRSSLLASVAGSGPYAPLRDAIEDQAARCFSSERLSSTPEAVAATVERALTERRPRSRYAVSANGRLLIGLRRILSDRAMDRMLRQQFGLTASGKYTGKYAK